MIRHSLKYPSLWQGCVGAWCPSHTGPTGATLRDHSLYARHGTLTNMDPATDWAVNSGGYSLDFDSTDDIVTTSVSLSANPFTFAAWVYPTSYGENTFGRMFQAGDMAFYMYGASNGVRLLPNPVSPNLLDYTPSVSLINRLTHLACSVSSSDVGTIWENGVLVASGAVAVFTNFTSFAIGNRASDTARTFSGWMDDIRLYNRVLLTSEVQLLATRRGIAYETNHRRSYKSAAAPPASTANNLMLLGVG